MRREEYIKKFVRNEEEIHNLLLLLSVSPHIIPEIKGIRTESYFIEKCSAVPVSDINPTWFKNVVEVLTKNLYINTSEFFSSGIYKYYFTSNSSKLITDNQFYLPYLCSELKNLLKRLDLDQDKSIKIQLNKIRSEVSFSAQWTPLNGFRLLHGDLHIGNIVIKNSKIYLIDFEHLRYGATELEIANFLVSCLLLLHRKKEILQFELQVKEFLNVVRSDTKIDWYAFNIMLNVSLLLLNIRYKIKSNEEMTRSLSEIRSLINLIES